MKWGCDHSPVGHTLERATTGEGGDLWTGWRCQWCGERFQLPGEVARYDLPLMEDVETEELPTEVVEMAALLWAMCASTPAISSEAEDVLHGGSPQWGSEEDAPVAAVANLAADSWIVVMKKLGGKKIDRSIRLAEAEALIRTGEVSP